jgi:exodeoxyribonuclease V alpha subunit
MEIGSDCMDDIDLAYAMTIHKSQGSEFANAIVVLPKNPGQMLLRNLVYTGITRGKKNVWIVSEGKSLEKSIRTSKKGERETTLSRCLRTV